MVALVPESPELDEELDELDEAPESLEELLVDEAESVLVDDEERDDFPPRASFR